MSKLNQVDLNLLISLQALLRTRSVTKAALQLNVTQSAMSRTLQRLRQQLGDPLFIRTRTGLEPTERVLALEANLNLILDRAEELFSTPEFDPLDSQKTFKLLMNDLWAVVFMPSIYQDLFNNAPNLHFECFSRAPNFMELLAKGEADLAFSSLEVDAQADIYAQELGQDKLITVMRDTHPLANKEMTIEEYCQYQHILITLGGNHLGAVDVALAKKGYQRDVALRLPHFIAAPHIVSKTDLLLTLPASIAQHLAKDLGLVLKAPPVELEGFEFYMVWHARQHNNQAHRWLRSQIAESFEKNFDMSWLAL